MSEQANNQNNNASSENQPAVGFIASMAGASVTVVGRDGSLKELQPGAPIFEGDILQVIEGSQVSITFSDGTVRELPRDGTFQITGQNYLQLARAEGYEEQVPVFEALLSALAKGEDPTALLEETARSGLCTVVSAMNMLPV